MVRASCRTAAVFEAIIFGVDCSERLLMFSNSTFTVVAVSFQTGYGLASRTPLQAPWRRLYVLRHGL